MNTAIMKNWRIARNGTGYRAGETQENRLEGIIHDDSCKRFSDGTSVKTSSIRKITDCGTHKLVETASTVYTVKPEDVNPDYEAMFPGAYERLQMATLEAQ